MAIPRYLWPDEYTKTELRAHLGSLAPAARIAFVEKLQHDVPGFSAHSVAEIVAADDSVLFRAWVARTYGLSKLRDDKELLVRAAYLESDQLWACTATDAEDVSQFRALSLTERLAWVRSPSLPRLVVEALFDTDSEALALSHQERACLIGAFLSGARFPVGAQSRNIYEFDLGDKLWKHAMRWTDRAYTFIRPAVFEHIEASDDARLDGISHVRDRASRHAILRNASPASKCVERCLDDPDDDIRGHAWSRLGFPDSRWEDPTVTPQWKRVFEGFDLAALRGLCRNPNLPAATRQKVAAQLGALGDVHGRTEAEKSLSQLIAQEDEDRREQALSTAGRLDGIRSDLAGLQKTIRLAVAMIAFLFVCVAVVLLRLSHP